MSHRSRSGLDPRRPEEIPLCGPDRARRVREMFARIVPRYDLLNRLMTAGQDVAWRRRTALAAQPHGARALDLATGTGDLALELRWQGARRVVAADYCKPMLEAARGKLRRRGAEEIDLVLADALALPFADASFDCVTSGFLLRNVADLPLCLREMQRVLRPGGRAAVLELTPILPGPLYPPVTAYLHQLVPRLGGLLSGHADAYRYLAASVRSFPDADHLAAMFREAGFTEVTYHRLGLGSAAIHVATREKG